ncbi:MAG: hypothetical protein ACRDRQ_23855 [Pseudonocardiaceae bacterium]
MIEELLKHASGRLLVPIVVVIAGVTLAKGLFSLQRSRSADRRDFLDVFQTWEGQSDLWLSAAVRHLFGNYLPPSLIRQLMGGRQPGRALLEVSNAWDFLDMDDETQELRWRRRRFASAGFRKKLGWFLTASYFVLGSIGLYLAYLTAFVGFNERSTVIAWVYVALFTFGAFFCLAYQENLHTAGKAANRWLGLP